MKPLYLAIFVVITTMSPIVMNAQYKGGIGDGTTFNAASNAAFGRNIFFGGSGDGFSTFLASNQPFGRNIFLGGNGDGFTSFSALNQPFGRNISLGGNGDGFTVATASNQPVGMNIFTGGGNDGWAMALGTNLMMTALPVTLTGFAGEWKADDAQLSWETNNEMNSARFELERSYDALHFEAAGTIPAAGQSSTARKYQYFDRSIRTRLVNGIVYYRLKMMDTDGKTSYSGIVILRTSISDVRYSMYPNPAREMITITSSAAAINEKTMIQLFDVSGRLVYTQQLTAVKQQVVVAALGSGTYFLQLIGSGKILYTQKLIIAK